MVAVREYIEDLKEFIDLNREEKVSLISNTVLTLTAAVSIISGWGFLTQILSLISGWIVQLSNLLTKGRKRAKNKQEELREAEELIKIFRKRAFTDLELSNSLEQESLDKEELKSKIVEQTGLKTFQVFPIVAEDYLSENMEYEEKMMVLILVLCRELEVKKDSRGSEVHEIKDQIRREVENCNFRFDDPKDLDQKSRKLIGSYESLNGRIKGSRQKKESELTSDLKNPGQATREFLMRYLPYDYGQNILSMIEKQENINFRETMRTVFRDGSLYLNNVSSDVKTEIEKQLDSVEEEYNSREVYLLFSENAFSKNHEDGRYNNILKSKFEYCEKIGSGLFMSWDRIRPEKNYENVDHFLDEVMKLLPEQKRENAQAFALSAQIGEMAAHPSPKEIEAGREKPNGYENKLDKMKLLETGKIDTLEIAIDSLIGQKISIHRLLGSLPLTAFVDEEISEKEKRIMSDNYSDYKQDTEHKDSEIENLFDWADLSRDQIENLLITYSNDEIGESRWREIAGELHERARRIDRASTGIS